MSKWTEIYRHKSKQPEFEAWACKGCGSQQDLSHEAGPDNGICHCPKCVMIIGSNQYRDNYERVFGHS